MIFRRAFRRVWFAVLVAAAVTLGLGYFYLDYVMPFDLDRPPSFLTKFHLQTLKQQPDRCMAALERASVDFRPVLPEQRDNGCGYDDGVRLLKSDIDYGSRILLTCPAMLALLSWERHVLVPKAREYFDRKVRTTGQLGTYACRKIGGQKGSRLSQHAYANAIDISGFTLEGGERISVQRDWNDAGAKGRFLRDLRDGACGYFGATLSPEFNAAHANHFHFDMGAIRICR